MIKPYRKDRRNRRLTPNSFILTRKQARRRAWLSAAKEIAGGLIALASLFALLYVLLLIGAQTP